MNHAIEGVYHDGCIELIEKPKFDNPVGVLVIFLENRKKIKKIGGLFRDFSIDYDQIEADIKELNQKSSAHILTECENGL